MFKKLYDQTTSINTDEYLSENDFIKCMDNDEKLIEDNMKHRIQLGITNNTF